MRRMLNDSVSSITSTNVGAAYAYKRLPSCERSLDVERTNDVAAVYLEAPLLPESSSRPGWRLSLPHVATATLASVLFGYHMGPGESQGECGIISCQPRMSDTGKILLHRKILPMSHILLRVVNVPLQHIGKDLLFAGHTILQGFVVSVSLASAFVGCALSGTVADVVGRRRAFQISCIPMIIGAVISAISTHVGAMILGRFIVGLGLGLSGPVTAMYVSEISPPSVRGTYGSFIQIATCIGILASLVAGLPAHSVPGWWRACFWIAVVPAAMLAIGMELCAESPRWLYKQGRMSEAEHELEILWGSAHVKQAMADLVRNEQTQDNGTTSWGALVDPRYIKVVTIGAALFAFQQFAGINAIFYFSTTVFRKAGMASDVSASVLVGVVNLLASCVAAYLMDSLGRRSLLMMSFSGMGLAMGLQAVIAAVPAFASLRASVALLGTLLYVFMFALGAGPVPALLLPEIFPDRIRAKGMAVAMCVHWVANFLVGLTFLHLLKTLGTSILYSIFTVVCVSATFFVNRNVVETKGRTLEEIECMLLPSL